MSKHKANVIVYVKPPVKQGQIKTISHIVAKMIGVSGTETSDKSRSFFSVSYDPFATDSHQIIECVRDQGYNAVLVGM